MGEKPITKRGGARPGSGPKPRHETAAKTYTIRLGGPAEALYLKQPEGSRSAYVEAALLAYRPE